MDASKIPICVPCLTGNEKAYLHDCITSNFVSSVGPYVNKFEDAVARSCGASSAVATCSGTAALHLALLAVGVAPGDLVIMPSFTFIATANAVSYCGATPWLMDITPGSLTLDVNKLSIALAEETRMDGRSVVHKRTGQRISAILPVYTLGHPADMEPLCRVARQYNLPVVADAACALGARYQSRPLSEISDLCTFSFNGNKTFTCGGGGAVAGNDPRLLARCRHLSTTARVGGEYHHDEIGFNYRMPNVNAAVGCAQLERIDGFIHHKREIARRYQDAARNFHAFLPLASMPWAESTAWLSGVVIRPDVGLELNDIIRTFTEWGIEARPFWKPIHLQPAYQNAPVFEVAQCESMWQRLLILPSSVQLSESEQSYVIDCLGQMDSKSVRC